MVIRSKIISAPWRSSYRVNPYGAMNSKIQEAYETIQRMEIWSDFEDEYTSDICYGWYELEKVSEDLYMDNCNF